METLTIPYHISTGEPYLKRLLHIKSLIAEQEAIFLRSTSGCGATDEHFHVIYVF
jgi:hypothetical protein